MEKKNKSIHKIIKIITIEFKNSLFIIATSTKSEMSLFQEKYAS